MASIYPQPLPRARPRVRALRFARRVLLPVPLFVARALSSRAGGVAFGAVLQVVTFLFLFYVTVDQRLFCALLLVSSMAAIVSWCFTRPESRRGNELHAGWLTASAAFGIGLSLTFWPLLLIWILLPLVVFGAPSVWAFACLPVALHVATLTLALHAWRARQRVAGPAGAAFWVGLLAPFALALGAQLALNRGAERGVERMLAGDRARALATAQAWSRFPDGLVSWQPIVDAWLDAKGGLQETENERSSHIADVFQRLADVDLRRSHDPRAGY